MQAGWLQLCRDPGRLCALMTVAVFCAGSALRAAEVAQYCTELRQVAALVSAKEKFASIIGKERQGNFLESKVALPGWDDCAFYGARTYTCDSLGFHSVDDGDRLHAKAVEEIKSCLGGEWTEVPGQASPRYVVLHDRRQLASITVNTDQNQKGEQVVRLILFLRGR
jgi:hypothetical protein